MHRVERLRLSDPRAVAKEVSALQSEGCCMSCGSSITVISAPFLYGCSLTSDRRRTGKAENTKCGTGVCVSDC